MHMNVGWSSGKYIGKIHDRTGILRCSSSIPFVYTSSYVTFYKYFRFRDLVYIISVRSPETNGWHDHLDAETHIQVEERA